MGWSPKPSKSNQIWPWKAHLIWKMSRHSKKNVDECRAISTSFRQLRVSSSTNPSNHVPQASSVSSIRTVIPLQPRDTSVLAGREVVHCHPGNACPHPGGPVVSGLYSWNFPWATSQPWIWGCPLKATWAPHPILCPLGTTKSSHGTPLTTNLTKKKASRWTCYWTTNALVSYRCPGHHCRFGPCYMSVRSGVKNLV